MYLRNHNPEVIKAFSLGYSVILTELGCGEIYKKSFDYEYSYFSMLSITKMKYLSVVEMAHLQNR